MLLPEDLKPGIPLVVPAPTTFASIAAVIFSDGGAAAFGKHPANQTIQSRQPPTNQAKAKNGRAAMNIDSRDVHAMQSFRPPEVAANLEARWRAEQSRTANGSLWVRCEATKQMESVVPVEPAENDCTMRLSRLPQTIAISEERLQADVSVDCMNKRSP